MKRAATTDEDKAVVWLALANALQCIGPRQNDELYRFLIYVNKADVTVIETSREQVKIHDKGPTRALDHCVAFCLNLV